LEKFFLCFWLITFEGGVLRGKNLQFFIDLNEMQIGGHKGVKSEKNDIFRHFEFTSAEKFEKYFS